MGALLSIVSLSRPEYDIVHYNCYWFVAIIIRAIEVAHGGQVAFMNTGASAGHLGVLPVLNSVDMERDLQKVVPAWAAQKAIYRAKKTTQEVSLGLFTLS